jgi:hypothetical protein
LIASTSFFFLSNSLQLAPIDYSESSGLLLDFRLKVCIFSKESRSILLVIFIDVVDEIESSDKSSFNPESFAEAESGLQVLRCLALPLSEADSYAIAVLTNLMPLP